MKTKFKNPSVFLKHTAYHEAGHLLMALKQERYVESVVIREPRPKLPWAGLTTYALKDPEPVEENLKMTVAGMIAVKVGFKEEFPNWRAGAASDIEIAMGLAGYNEYKKAQDEVEEYFREPEISNILEKLAVLLLRKRAVNYNDIFEAIE
jgi:hypothetical protein